MMLICVLIYQVFVANTLYQHTLSEFLHMYTLKAAFIAERGKYDLSEIVELPSAL